jgi:uncharacterized repeat protein (TIGR01451 family)
MRPAFLDWNSSRRSERRAGRTPSQARRVIKGGLASALAVVGLVAFATPAFAHNDIVTASAACNSPLGSGFKITWTIENDYNLSETGTVTSVTGGLGSLSSTSFSIAKSPHTPYSSTTLTQTLPATASGTITLDISSTWSDNYSVTDAGSVSLSSLNCAAPKQTIAGHIYLCNNGNPTTIEKTGGMLAAGGSGLSTVSPTANPLAATDVIAGTYSMTASSPPGYALVKCGASSSPNGSGSSATESVNVPSGGAGVGVFYVTQVQTLAGHIYLCNNGTPTSNEVSGGTVAAGGSGLTTIAATANPLAPTDVIAGTYTVTATSPANYQLVKCGGSSSPNGSGSSATESVNVPGGGAGIGVFYASPVVTSLSISKSTSTASVSSVGDTIHYSFVVSNTGNVTLTDVGVTDNPVSPAGALISGPTCISLATPTGSCSASTSTTLVPGQVATFTGSYDVTQADLNMGSVNDTSTATGHFAGDTITANSNQVSVPVVQTSSLTIVKSTTTSSVSHVGDAVSYGFVITNNGNVTVSGITVTDNPMAPAGPLTSSVVCESPPSTTCSNGAGSVTLAPGQQATFGGTYAATQADLDHGSIKDTAAANGLSPSGAPVSATSNEVIVPVIQDPAITILKSTTVTSVSHVGATIPYTFVVTNTGNVTLTSVDVNDTQEAPAGPLTSGPTCVSLSDPSGTCSGSTASSLAPGQSATFGAAYTVTQADLDNGSVNDSATSTGTTPDDGTITSDPSTATVSSTQVPGISVVKTASVNSVSAVGQTVTYSFAVTNTGNVTLNNVDVTDAQAVPSLDADLGPISCTTGTNGSITLAPGASDTCSATYTVTQADLTKGSITDTASATGDPHSGAPVSAHSTLTLSVTSLSVVKSASPSGGVMAGSTVPIVYTITVKNSGTATTSEQTVVTDSAPTGTTLISGSPACATGGPPTCTVAVSESTITWTIPAGVAPGASYTLTFAVTANASDATGTIANTASWSGPSCGAPGAVGTPTTCPTNTVDTPVTAAPVTGLAAVTPATPTTTTTASPKTSPSTTSVATPAIAFTGALLSQEWMIGLAALLVGAGLVIVARRRRRSPKHSAE